MFEIFFILKLGCFWKILSLIYNANDILRNLKKKNISSSLDQYKKINI